MVIEIEKHEKIKKTEYKQRTNFVNSLFLFFFCIIEGIIATKSCILYSMKWVKSKILDTESEANQKKKNYSHSS